MAHLIDIYLEPTKVFADLKEKPTFVVPLLVTMALATAMVLFYFFSVDPDWYIDHTLLSSGKEMTAAEIAQAKEFMPGARMMGYIGAVTTPITFVLLYCIYALYYMLAGKVTGTGIGFKHGLALAAWSNMPNVLGTVVALVAIATMEPQTGLEAVMLTNLDPLLVQLPFDHAWSSFAKGFNLVMFWVVFLGAVGWRTWGRTGWGEAIAVSAFPAVLIYGIWALIAAL